MTRARRETYLGPWLPEPVMETEDEADDISLPLLMALDRLSPLERAAFLLHDVFDVGFAEVAEAIGRDEASCRQLARRARNHLKAARPRYRLPKEKGLAIAQAFYSASQSGDLTALQSLLTDDIAVYTDGGKRPASLVPVCGLDRAMPFFGRLCALLADKPKPRPSYGLINGLPGYLTVEADGLLQTIALAIRDETIVGIYVMRNPNKLRHLAGRAAQ